MSFKIFIVLFIIFIAKALPKKTARNLGYLPNDEFSQLIERFGQMNAKLFHSGYRIVPGGRRTNDDGTVLQDLFVADLLFKEKVECDPEEPVNCQEIAKQLITKSFKDTIVYQPRNKPSAVIPPCCFNGIGFMKVSVEPADFDDNVISNPTGSWIHTLKRKPYLMRQKDKYSEYVEKRAERIPYEDMIPMRKLSPCGRRSKPVLQRRKLQRYSLEPLLESIPESELQDIESRQVFELSDSRRGEDLTYIQRRVLESIRKRFGIGKNNSETNDSITKSIDSSMTTVDDSEVEDGGIQLRMFDDTPLPVLPRMAKSKPVGRNPTRTRSTSTKAPDSKDITTEGSVIGRRNFEPQATQGSRKIFQTKSLETNTLEIAQPKIIQTTETTIMSSTCATKPIPIKTSASLLTTETVRSPLRKKSLRNVFQSPEESITKCNGTSSKIFDSTTEMAEITTNSLKRNLPNKNRLKDTKKKDADSASGEKKTLEKKPFINNFLETDGNKSNCTAKENEKVSQNGSDKRAVSSEYRRRTYLQSDSQVIEMEEISTPVKSTEKVPEDARSNKKISSTESGVMGTTELIQKREVSTSSKSTENVPQDIKRNNKKKSSTESDVLTTTEVIEKKEVPTSTKSTKKVPQGSRRSSQKKSSTESDSFSTTEVIEKMEIQTSTNPNEKVPQDSKRKGKRKSLTESDVIATTEVIDQKKIATSTKSTEKLPQGSRRNNKKKSSTESDVIATTEVTEQKEIVTSTKSTEKVPQGSRRSSQKKFSTESDLFSTTEVIKNMEIPTSTKSTEKVPQGSRRNNQKKHSTESDVIATTEVIQQKEIPTSTKSTEKAPQGSRRSSQKKSSTESDLVSTTEVIETMEIPTSTKSTEKAPQDSKRKGKRKPSTESDVIATTEETPEFRILPDFVFTEAEKSTMNTPHTKTSTTTPEPSTQPETPPEFKILPGFIITEAEKPGFSPMPNTYPPTTEVPETTTDQILEFRIQVNYSIPGPEKSTTTHPPCSCPQTEKKTEGPSELEMPEKNAFVSLRAGENASQDVTRLRITRDSASGEDRLPKALTKNTDVDEEIIEYRMKQDGLEEGNPLLVISEIDDWPKNIPEMDQESSADETFGVRSIRNDMTIPAKRSITSANNSKANLKKENGLKAKLQKGKISKSSEQVPRTTTHRTQSTKYGTSQKERTTVIPVQRDSKSDSKTTGSPKKQTSTAGFTSNAHGNTDDTEPLDGEIKTSRYIGFDNIRNMTITATVLEATTPSTIDALQASNMSEERRRLVMSPNENDRNRFNKYEKPIFMDLITDPKNAGEVLHIYGVLVTEPPIERTTRRKQMIPQGQPSAYIEDSRPPPQQPPFFPNKPPSESYQPLMEPNQPPRLPNQPPQDSYSPLHEPSQIPHEPNQPPRGPYRPPRDPNPSPAEVYKPPRQPNQPPHESYKPPREEVQPSREPNQPPHWPYKPPREPNQPPHGLYKPPNEPSQISHEPNKPPPGQYNKPPRDPNQSPHESYKPPREQDQPLLEPYLPPSRPFQYPRQSQQRPRPRKDPPKLSQALRPKTPEENDDSSTPDSGKHSREDSSENISPEQENDSDSDFDSDSDSDPDFDSESDKLKIKIHLSRGTVKSSNVVRSRQTASNPDIQVSIKLKDANESNQKAKPKKPQIISDEEVEDEEENGREGE